MCGEQLELRDAACYFITAMHYRLLCLERSHSIMVHLVLTTPPHPCIPVDLLSHIFLVPSFLPQVVG